MIHRTHLLFSGADWYFSPAVWSHDRMWMTSEVVVDMISTEEASGEGTIREGVPLRKGPWTKEEDEILIDYLAKHGKGNWNDIHKVTGLARCGKSCRLRWSNHLRPDLKKGPFTREEKALIIELHARIGNKWSQMAAELPGRTDNEIKNFWNTRVKRIRRAGLLMNHRNACFQGLREIIRNKEPGPSSVVNPYPDDLLPSYNFEIPSPVFNNFEPNQLYPPELLNVVASSFPDIPGTSLLDCSLGSSSLYPPFSGEILPSSSETMIGRDVSQDTDCFSPTDTLDDLLNRQLFSETDCFSAPDFWSDNSLW